MKPFAGNGRIAPRTLDFVARFPSCSPAMTKQPFFAKRGDTFIPNPVSNGPWDPNSMHGRVVIGLLAHAIEEHHGSDEFVPARLTVDMFRLPNIQTPVEVTTKLIRDGKRIKVVEAEFFSGGTSMARASCQLLRRTENAPGNVWSPSNWDAPLPDTIPAPTDPPVRHERQMDDAAHCRRDGLARPPAAVDERGS
jgi:hypothetical protein